jgi:serine/threonine-protein kinase RsbW
MIRPPTAVAAAGTLNDHGRMDWPNPMTESQEWGWQADIDLPSERGASRLVLDDLLEQLAIHGWEHSDIFGVHLAAEEAIVNAILHGNRLDPTKKVRVSCRVSSRHVRVEVTDEGPGFRPEEVPDCTREDRLEEPGGRGLLLMRSFMTRIEYNDRGNSVLLEKKLGAFDEK